MTGLPPEQAPGQSNQLVDWTDGTALWLLLKSDFVGKDTEHPAVSTSQWLLAAAVGLSLACGVWWGLVTGGGLVGGDTYPYFFPQKIVVAESFARGEIPLWHHLTGLGYPLHAESQAAVFYPTTQVLYRLLDINSAYNANIVLHYWLAFVFAWRFARCQRISNWPALLAALIFVYGWFPARISLEWSIVGGVWLPLTLWLTDRFMDVPNRRRFAILAACLAVHLVAGHFTLAFINQLTICGYAVLRSRMKHSGEIASSAPVWRKPVLVGCAVLVGLAAAAVQLVPTFELKQMSQREGGGKAFDPAYGHMPPAYLSQVAGSWWYWHTPEVKASGGLHTLPGSVVADTNAVEAHLYWGLIPLGLIACCCSARLRRAAGRVPLSRWLILTTAALIYATGWLLPFTRYLPGFGFFMGPGRYTIVAALGGSLLAAAMLDALLSKRQPRVVAVVTVAVMALTLPDLLWSSRAIADAVVVRNPPVNRLADSWIRKKLATSVPQPVRLLAPGQNVCNLYGVSCVPQYLGIGPSVYYTERLRPATSRSAESSEFGSEDWCRNIQSLGVTHVLSLEEIDNLPSQLSPAGQYPDSYLNAVWGRGGAPVYLYEVDSQIKRVYARPHEALSAVRTTEHTPNLLTVEVELSQPAELIFTELDYPGWNATVDDGPAQTVRHADQPFRAVQVSAGAHTVRWSFQPWSFGIGAAVSLMTLVVLLVLICRPAADLAPSR